MKMKYSNKTAVVFSVLLVVALSITVFAGGASKPTRSYITSYNDFSVFSKEEYSRIEKNLLIGIKSNNAGLQKSSAYFLGEMKSDKAMIPLLRLVTNGKTEESRIIAALSLYKIESKIGMYRLKGLAQSDENELVRKVFDRLYKIYVSKNYSF
jgi:HEAT repeat protein